MSSVVVQCERCKKSSTYSAGLVMAECPHCKSMIDLKKAEDVRDTN